MKKLVLALSFLPFFLFAQQSIIQEQSNHYKNFNYTNDSQWDSLYTIENGVPIAQTTLLAKTTATCTLNKKVYGWHPYWVGSVYTNYDWSMLSDFCYFDYGVSPTTGNNTNGSFAWSTSAAVTAAKTNSVAIHFCATLFSSHSTFWASSTAQQTFITNAINLLNSRGGNGINIDFEGMGSADKAPFTAFMTSLCNQVHAANPNYKVSMALYAVEWGNNTFDMAALNPLVDDFIIMGYDYYYSGSTTAGPEAPLYNFQTSYNYTLAKSITHYLNKGASKNKLLLGLPWYGREWATVGQTAPSAVIGPASDPNYFTSSRTYAYVRNNAAIYSAANKKWEGNSFNPYFSYMTGGAWRQCWIDDDYSYSRKFDLVNQRGIGGIGIWALGYDDGYSNLWNLIKNKFSNCAVVPCTDSIYDMGGPARNHYDNESYVYTIAPTGASKVRLTFSQMDLEVGYDSLYLFDGATTTAPLLGAYSGTVIPGIINSTGPAITVKFKSDVATVKAGFKAIWNCIQDNTSPTTQITIPSGWITQNFVTNYTDIDNSGGTGIEKSFYQPTYYNGFEWRANGNRGFFNDDFDTAIHPEWTNAIGTWSIVSGSLVQSDETNANTNIYATVTQSLSNRYLYCFKGSISGTGTNRRAGIYIACDNPTLSQRGNSYMIWFRPDQSAIEFYKSVSNTIGLPTFSASCVINPNTTYDYKISYDRITGEIKVWMNNVYITSWTDPSSPHANGTAVSFRSGNSNFKIDDFKIFRSRAASHTILVGSSNSNDLRNENMSPQIAGGKISSITKDNANNLSTISSQIVDIDWTKPVKPTLIKDGTANDIDTTYVGSQLDLNYTAAKDTNSGVTTYYYAIGTTTGAQNTIAWTANALALSATETGMTLTSGQKYYIMVKAMNGAGLVSDSTVSDGVLYLLATGINTPNALNDLSIYPNPTNDKATISLVSSTDEKLQYTLFDAQGKLIEQQELHVTAGITTLQIDVQKLQLSNGVYFIKFALNGKESVRKLIVK